MKAQFLKVWTKKSERKCRIASGKDMKLLRSRSNGKCENSLGEAAEKLDAHLSHDAPHISSFFDTCVPDYLWPPSSVLIGTARWTIDVSLFFLIHFRMGLRLNASLFERRLWQNVKTDSFIFLTEYDMDETKKKELNVIGNNRVFYSFLLNLLLLNF